MRASLAADVVVATCDPEIADFVHSAGGRAIMTAETHERCTSRVAEAARSLTADVVVIVQGDEPLLDPLLVDAVVRPFNEDGSIVCTNLLSPVSGDEERGSPDVVKAAVGRTGNILYFTRAPIPFFRHRIEAPVYRQTGIMALGTDLLARFDHLPVGPLELAESVDMLRLLESGIPIRAVVADSPTIGVDRPEDIARVERALAASTG